MVYSDTFNGRIIDYYTSHLRGHGGRNVGIITTQGETWKTHRRFALRILKGLLLIIFTASIEVLQ